MIIEPYWDIVIYCQKKLETRFQYNLYHKTSRAKRMVAACPHRYVQHFLANGTDEVNVLF